MTAIDDSSALATTRRRPGVIARLAVAAAVVGIMTLGIVVLGRIADDDVMAMVFTTVFFGIVAGVLGVIVLRHRHWLIPLALPFVLVAAVSGVLLGRPLITDQVVDETVVSADQSVGARQLAAGTFTALSHPGQGKAAIVQQPDGQRVLTLTDFATDNGPDLRVRLSSGTTAGGASSAVIDLGALKGNKGDQQYAIPAGADLADVDAVLIWCRAFDVGFTQAALTATA